MLVVVGEGERGADLGWRRCEGVDSPRCSLPRSLLISNQLPHHPSQFNMDTVPTICIAFSSLLMLCYVHGLVEYQCAIPLDQCQVVQNCVMVREFIINQIGSYNTIRGWSIGHTVIQSYMLLIYHMEHMQHTQHTNRRSQWSDAVMSLAILLCST